MACLEVRLSEVTLRKHILRFKFLLKDTLNGNLEKSNRVRKSMSWDSVTKSQISISTEATTVDKEPEYYERCPIKQAKIDKRKATREEHLKTWLSALGRKSNSLYSFDICDEPTTEEGFHTLKTGARELYRMRELAYDIELETQLRGKVSHWKVLQFQFISTT